MDCAFVESDYHELRHQLFEARHIYGDVALAPSGPRCERALQDVLRNAPLLQVTLADELREDTCTLVLRAWSGGWGLDPAGPCGQSRPFLALDLESLDPKPILWMLEPRHRVPHELIWKRTAWNGELVASIDQIR